MNYWNPSREKVLEMVDNELLDCRDALVMCLKYMSEDDVEDLMEMNEISERFLEEFE